LSNESSQPSNPQEDSSDALFILSPDRQSIRIKLERRVLPGMSLSNTDLSFVDFGCIDLSRKSLRNSNLSFSNLSKVDGLTHDKLSGTNLRGASLPGTLKEFGAIAHVGESSKNINTILLTLLGAIGFSILTIFQTTDTALFSNSGGAKLPIVQADLPVALFYLVSPFLLLSIYIYMNIQVARLWVPIGSLPEIFEDGLPIYNRLYPWFFIGLFHIFSRPRYYVRPTFFLTQGFISTVVLFILMPVFLFGIFLRYLAIQDLYGSAILGIASSMSIVYSVTFFVYAKSAFSPKRLLTYESNLTHESNSSKLALPLLNSIKLTSSICLLFVLHLIFAWAAVFSAAPTATSGSLESSIPQILSALKLSPFANLTGSELAKRPSEWDPKEPTDASIAKIPRLALANIRLRHANAKGMFAANADLSGADLYGAQLDHAELQGAQLVDARLGTTSLYGALLAKASFEHDFCRTLGLEAQL
jgi:uncharacterized protein YjbI with pentapeptide repeats